MDSGSLHISADVSQINSEILQNFESLLQLVLPTRKAQIVNIPTMEIFFFLWCYSNEWKPGCCWTTWTIASTIVTFPNQE